MRVPRWPPATVLVLLAASGCGGDGDGTVTAPVGQPSDTCAAAFAEAGETTAADGDAELERDGSQGTQSDDEQGMVGLSALRPTLDACVSFDDWLAGARGARDAVPTSMDAETALRALCDGADGADGPQPPACVGLAEGDTSPAGSG